MPKKQFNGATWGDLQIFSLSNLYPFLRYKLNMGDVGVAGPVWILFSKFFIDGLVPLYKMCVCW